MKRSLLKVAVLGVFTGLALCISPGSLALAQTDEVSQMRQRITQLEDRVRELEDLLKECSDFKKAGAEELAWQNKKNWRSLEAGMKEEQVRKLLGEPVKVIKGVRTLWYYPNIYGGYVSFDEMGSLTKWNEP